MYVPWKNPPEFDPESDPGKTPYRLLVSRDVFCVIVSLIFCAVERERVDDSTIGFRQRATLQTKSLSAKKMKFEVTVKNYIWNTNADPQKVMVLPNVGAYIPYPSISYGFGVFLYSPVRFTRCICFSWSPGGDSRMLGCIAKKAGFFMGSATLNSIQNIQHP